MFTKAHRFHSPLALWANDWKVLASNPAVYCHCISVIRITVWFIIVNQAVAYKSTYCVSIIMSNSNIK